MVIRQAGAEAKEGETFRCVFLARLLEDAWVELVDEVVRVLVLGRALDLDAESFLDPPEGSTGK